jgi:glycosyltransferase involved in cell wall biosynthesis
VSPGVLNAKVSIITVVRNDLPGLSLTVDSVRRQIYTDFQFVIIDGQSTDGTEKYAVTGFEEGQAVFLSEPDLGIYDAMNKGLAMANGQWVVFMNAGDQFADPESLAMAMQLAGEDADIVYSDVVFDRGGRRETVHCDWTRRRFHHQAIVYRTSLHQKYLAYIVAPGVTISDYLFFNSVIHMRWVKCPSPIAVCNAEGRSSRPNAYYQKLAADLILGLKSRPLVATMLLLYPLYHRILKPLRQIISR